MACDMGVLGKDKAQGQPPGKVMLRSAGSVQATVIRQDDLARRKGACRCLHCTIPWRRVEAHGFIRPIEELCFTGAVGKRLSHAVDDLAVDDNDAVVVTGADSKRRRG